ncbi:MAG: LysR family transcriptional regulator [Pseudomonadota bacterium]
MDLEDFDLNLLMTFNAIYRHQNLSAAAEEMGLTQPAVSAALKRMRLRFGNPLFVRTSHGMQPTPYSDNMAPKIGRILDLLREVDQPAKFSPLTTEINFKVYVNDVGLITVMPMVMRRLSDEAPFAKLTIVDLRPDEVIDALDSADIDLAIGYFLGMPDWAHQQNLRDTSFVCAVRSDHPDIGDALSLEQFLAAGHAVYWSTSNAYSALEGVLAQLNLTREVKLRVPRLSAMPFLIAQSDLIVTIPEDLGLIFSRLINIKLFKPPLPLANFQIKQYWHERLHADPAYRWLRKLVKEETARLGRLNK